MLVENEISLHDGMSLTSSVKKEQTIEYNCKNRRMLLKIKLMSLAAESRIIRKEVKKCPVERPHLQGLMHEHRVIYLRAIARDTHIAYGLLKGLPYLKIENKAYDPPNWSKIEEMMAKYGRHYPSIEIKAIVEKAKQDFREQLVNL